MSREVNDGWVCIRHRCVKHYDVPAQNVNEASGAEWIHGGERIWPPRCAECGRLMKWDARVTET